MRVLKLQLERIFICLLLTVFFPLFSPCSQALAAAKKPESSLLFTDVTQQAGFSSLDKSKTYSAAAADYNLDGFIDILICHHNKLSLWTNTGNNTFKDSSDLLVYNKGDMHGVSFIDINNDGFVDICVSLGANRGRGSGGNLFLLNQKGEAFTHLSDPPEVLSDPKGRGRSLTPTDFNNDGLIDLLIVNQYQEGRPNRIAVADKDGGYKDMGPISGISSINTAGFKVVDLNNDGTNYYVGAGHGPDSGKIYMKKGNTLEDVSKSLGISEKNVISCLPFDYDNDNDLDLLFLHRTFSKPLGVSVVDGEIHFSYYGRESQNSFRSAITKGKVVVDVRFEGRIKPELLFLGANKAPADILPWQGRVSDAVLAGKPVLQSDDTGLFMWYDEQHFLNFHFAGSNSLEAVFGSITAEGFKFANVDEQPPKEPPKLILNSFYRNDNGKFSRVDKSVGLEGSGLGRDAIAADFNNDGYLDVYQVNAGYSFTGSNPANHLFFNKGDGTFVEVAEKSLATGPQNGAGNGAIAFDYDNDGDLDLFLYNGFVTRPTEPGPIMLLKNDNANIGRSIQLDARGTASNSRGWGTRVIVNLNGKYLYRQKYGLNGFLASSDLPIHIGLSKSHGKIEILVKWPSGKKQNAQMDQNTSSIILHETN